MNSKQTIKIRWAPEQKEPLRQTAGTAGARLGLKIEALEERVAPVTVRCIG